MSQRLPCALLARVSILSVCVLAVSAAPARGQSPTCERAANVPAVKTEDAPTKAAGEASSADQPGRDAGYDQALGNAREGVGEQGGQRRDRCHAERRRRKRPSKKTPLRKRQSNPWRPRQTPTSVLGPSERSCATAGFELDQRRLQDQTFRERLRLDAIYNSARPQGPGTAVFSGSEVCRRIFAAHH